MRFTVLWTPAAESQLAALWLIASDQLAVTMAANTIDRRLARNPESQGEALFDTVRLMAIAPLAVEFEVLDADRLVYVLSVWRVV